jgi:hypothetical protein
MHYSEVLQNWYGADMNAPQGQNFFRQASPNKVIDSNKKSIIVDNQEPTEPAVEQEH